MQVGKRAYGKVVKVKCVICAKYESRIKTSKGSVQVGSQGRRQ